MPRPRGLKHTALSKEKMKNKVLQLYREGKHRGGFKKGHTLNNGKTPWNLGIPRTLLEKEKMSKTHKGWKPSIELRKTWSDQRAGENNSQWKGGRFKANNGYILVRVSKGIYIPEHKLVLEKHLKRKLKISERIHHINGIKTDNRIENLLLCKNQKKHMAIHYAMWNFVYKLIREDKIFYHKKNKEFKYVKIS